FKRTGTVPDIGVTGPVVTAPIQIAGELRGLVVMPPPPPPGGGPIVRDVGRLLSWPGALVLIVAATIAGAGSFRPARAGVEGARGGDRTLRRRRPDGARARARRRRDGARRQRVQSHGAGAGGAGRSAADFGSAAAADAGRRVARAEDAADGDARLRRDAE